VAQANVKLTVDATNATRALKGVQNKTNQLQKSFGGLQTQVAKVASAIALVGTSRFVFFKTAELETQRKSLEVLTGSVRDTNKIIKELQQFGAVTPFTSSELIEQTKRLKAFGFETDELVDTTKRLSEVAGATGADLQGIAAAFGQIRAKGKLQQEENLQLLERGVDITTELKRITGLQGDAFEKAQRQGKIGADKVNQALINLTNQGGAFFGGATAQATTLNGKLSTLQDSFDSLARTIGQSLSPALKTAITAFSDLTLSASDFLQTSEGQTAVVLTGIALAAKGLIAVSTILSGALTVLAAKFKLTSAGAIAMAKAQSTAAISTKALAISSGALAIAMNALPLVAIAGGFVFLTNAIIKAINKQKEFNELLEDGSSSDLQAKIDSVTKKIDKLKEAKAEADKQDFLIFSPNQRAELLGLEKDLIKLQKRLVIAQGLELSREFQKAKEALKEKNEALKINLQRTKIATEEGKKQFDQEQRRIELTEKYGEELAKIILKLEKENQKLEEGAEKIKKKQEETDKLKEKMAAVGEEIENNIKDNLREAITGAQSFGQAMTNVLNKIRDKIIDAQLDKLLGQFGENFAKGGQGGKGLGGFLGKILGGLFADGGRPPVGKASIVGERGPELFVPKVGGTIIPNNQLGGSTTNIINVSVDASGSSVQGNEGQGQALGQLIASVVQTTIVQEQRSGGLLSK
tara:strand:+ start:485 stop:2569 length:2085 start_codon:yes stop_codon:yes gene_type:complete